MRSLSLACRLLPFSLCSHMAERETASESEMSARASEQERDTSCLMSLLMRTQILSYWRRKWQPTPVFLPGESYREAWWATTCGVAESGMTEHAHTHPILKVLPSGPQVTIITSQRPASKYHHLGITTSIYGFDGERNLKHSVHNCTLNFLLYLYLFFSMMFICTLSFWWNSGKEFACQCRKYKR